ncbi:MAG TPA: hypothetical protein ENO09_09715 [bacterium]|nr:hypothetical protein [bacterium]
MGSGESVPVSAFFVQRFPYGSFSYTKQTEQAIIGPLSISVSEKETINVPVWAGGGAIALGIVLLLVGRRKA